jgi:hypothetical protein
LLTEKQSNLKKLVEKINSSTNKNIKEKQTIKNQIIEKTKNLEELNKNYILLEEKKTGLFSLIKDSFKKLSEEEINLLKLKDQDHKVICFNNYSST